MAAITTSSQNQVGSHQQEHHFKSTTSSTATFSASPSHRVSKLHRPSTMDTTFGTTTGINGDKHEHEAQTSRQCKNLRMKLAHREISRCTKQHQAIENEYRVTIHTRALFIINQSQQERISSRHSTACTFQGCGKALPRVEDSD